MNNTRVLIVIFAVLLGVMLLNQISLAGTTISDTDPSTYVIVPMLMLPFFALFMLKENFVSQVEWKDIVLGIVLFCVFLLFGRYVNVYMQFVAASYRMSLLLLPIAIAALAVLLFGSKNLGRFSFIAVYALFASPLLLLPVFNLNPGFATLNTMIVYHIAKTFFPTLSYTPPISLVLNGSVVTIGETCVGIGALIGMAMFLLPLIYLYNGGARKKALWVFSGFMMLLVLNIARMVVIAILWFSNGPSEQLLNIHNVAGQMLFYGIIALMVLLSGMYGLSYPDMKSPAQKKAQRYNFLGIAVAVVFAFAYMVITEPFPSAYPISPVLIVNGQNATFTPSTLLSLLNSVSNVQNYTSQSIVSAQQNSAAEYVLNVSSNTTLPFIMLFGVPNSSLESELNSNRFLYKVDRLGNTAKIYEVDYNGNATFVYYRRVPFYSGSAYYQVDMYGIMTFNPSWQSGACESPLQNFKDDVINDVFFNFQNATTVGRINSAYCFMSKVIK